MRQSLKAKARNLGPLAPGAQWLWARLEPMGHGRPGPLRRTMPRRFGQNFLQTWRLMRCRLADPRRLETARQDWGWANVATAKFRRARPSAPSSSPCPVRTAPGRIGHCARALASPLCAWGQTAEGHRADAIRQSQSDAEAPKSRLEPGAQRDSPPPRVRLDTRIRIRAYGYAHVRARDLKLQIQKLNFQF